MARYAVKRVLLLIPTLILVCIITFALLRLVPGSAVDYMVYELSTSGIYVEEEEVEEMLGLDKPAVVQFFIWVGDLLQGDLGDSIFESESVWAIISRQLPVTLELSFLTLIFANVISIPLGILCAAKQDSIFDYVVRVISVLLMSVPVFFLGTLVLVYPAQWWGYAPPISYVSFFEDPIQNLQMFIVPALVGSTTQIGMQIRTIRTLILENMNQDYIRTARAKGVGDGRILFVHALRNAMIPVITMIGNSVAGLVGGSVIIESMFNIPGIGAQMVTSLGTRDYPVVQGAVLILSIIVMLINLVVDLSYKLIDPRVEID